jgi:hypothetical protein
MKRPQFLHAHIEWLYNNTNAFLGSLLTRLKEWGIKDYVNTYKINKETAEQYERLVILNDEQNEEYAKIKYNTKNGLCRSHSDTPITDRILTCGLYAYIETYGGITTGNKLNKYYEMIQDPILFECHCSALLERMTQDRTYIFPLYDISTAFT